MGATILGISVAGTAFTASPVDATTNELDNILISWDASGTGYGGTGRDFHSGSFYRVYLYDASGSTLLDSSPYVALGTPMTPGGALVSASGSQLSPRADQVLGYQSDQLVRVFGGGNTDIAYVTTIRLGQVVSQTASPQSITLGQAGTRPWVPTWFSVGDILSVPSSGDYSSSSTITASRVAVNLDGTVLIEYSEAYLGTRTGLLVARRALDVTGLTHSFDSTAVASGYFEIFQWSSPKMQGGKTYQLKVGIVDSATGATHMSAPWTINAAFAGVVAGSGTPALVSVTVAGVTATSSPVTTGAPLLSDIAFTWDGSTSDYSGLGEDYHKGRDWQVFLYDSAGTTLLEKSTRTAITPLVSPGGHTGLGSTSSGTTLVPRLDQVLNYASGDAFRIEGGGNTEDGRIASLPLSTVVGQATNSITVRSGDGAMFLVGDWLSLSTGIGGISGTMQISGIAGDTLYADGALGNSFIGATVAAQRVELASALAHSYDETATIKGLYTIPSWSSAVIEQDNLYQIRVGVTDDQTGQQILSSPWTLDAGWVPPITSPIDFTATPDDDHGWILLSWTLSGSLVGAELYARETGTTDWTLIAGPGAFESKKAFTRVQQPYDFKLRVYDSSGIPAPESVITGVQLDLAYNMFGVWVNEIADPTFSIMLGGISDMSSASTFDWTDDELSYVPDGSDKPKSWFGLQSYYNHVGRRYLVPAFVPGTALTTYSARLIRDRLLVLKDERAPVWFRDMDGMQGPIVITNVHQEHYDVLNLVLGFDLKQVDIDNPPALVLVG